jgi:hypothetical protein
VFVDDKGRIIVTAADLTKRAKLLGKRGGFARAAKMTPEERSEAARKAALARWGALGKKKKGTKNSS